MEIGEELHQGHYEILRVPGGWAYTRFSENETGGHDMSSCFVPELIPFTVVNQTVTHLKDKP